MAELDTVLRGGRVVDGTGASACSADVGIARGRIAKIGAIRPHEAKRVVDVAGLIVAPGVVDLHTHYDAQVHWDPYCTISSWHGTTSVTVGNCGFGFAPVRPEHADRAMLALSRNEAIPLETLKAALPFDWETFPQWLDHLDALPLGINVSHLVPVAPLLAYACGGFDEIKTRQLTRQELELVVALLEQALTAGAVGWGAQRLVPGSPVAFQRDHDGSPMITDVLGDDVYLALAAALRGHSGCFIQFSQAGADFTNLLSTLKQDMEFSMRLAAASGGPVVHNALAAIRGSERLLRAQIGWLSDANARGLPLIAQAASVRSPAVFTFEDWNLFDNSELWREATLGTVDERRRKLTDPMRRAALKDEYDSGRMPLGFFGALTDYVAFRVEDETLRARFEGRTTSDIARSQEKHIIDAMLDLSLEDDLRTAWMTPTPNDDPKLTTELMRTPNVIPGTSDGGAHLKFLTTGTYPTDYLSWLVRDEGLLTLEEAHHRLSALPARCAGLWDRGTLEPGKAADVIAYDLDSLAVGPVEVARDLPAGQWRRIRRSRGYGYVFVNGESIFEHGVCTGRTPGRLLRRNAGLDA